MQSYSSGTVGYGKGETILMICQDLKTTRYASRLFVHRMQAAHGPLISYCKPLPVHLAAIRSRSVSQRDKDCCTHPTSVQHWHHWEADVKERLQQADIQALRAAGMRYDIIGLHSYAYEVNEAVASSALYWNACLRLNQLFAKHDSLKSFRFTKLRIRTKANSQVAALNSLPTVERPPEEARSNECPDIGLVKTDSWIHPILQCTECKSRNRLAEVHKHLFHEVWNAARLEQRLGTLHPSAAYNAMAALSQALGYMARRGHKTGIISTYEYTWLLKTDGSGAVHVSDAIPSASQGDESCASVTEVLLYSALTNLVHDGKPYPTALQPGKLPVTLEEMESHTVQAVQELQRQEEPAEANSGTNMRRQTKSGATYATDSPMPPGLLNISSRLADGVCLGSVAGRVVAVRLAFHGEAQRASQPEAAVYQRLQSLQGRHVPHLIAHGYTCAGSAYFVAPEYVKGSAWDWQSPADCKLVGQLQAVVGEIHAAGVVHVDLESQNIKVTSNKEVYVLDFEKASVASMSPQYTEELCHEQARLDYLSTVVDTR